MSLKARLRMLEQQVPKAEWLILHCKESPTDDQQEEMEAAAEAGQVAILMIESGNTIWMVGYDRPWESNI